jgi:hypothetical protein
VHAEERAETADGRVDHRVVRVGTVAADAPHRPEEIFFASPLAARERPQKGTRAVGGVAQHSHVAVVLHDEAPVEEH